MEEEEEGNKVVEEEGKYNFGEGNRGRDENTRILLNQRSPRN